MYNLLNLNHVIEASGESTAKLLLSTFSSRNNDVHHFVQYDAVEFALKKIAVTYVVASDDEVLGIFTLANKNVTIPVTSLSKTQEKRLKRFATMDNENEKYTAPAILIAQFSKNANVEKDKAMKGSDLMDIALAVVRSIQDAVGGKLVWLECESDNQVALDFYRGDEVGFKEFAKRESLEGPIYIQMLKWL